MDAWRGRGSRLFPLIMILIFFEQIFFFQDNKPLMICKSQDRKAFLTPFFTFVGLLGLSQLLQSLFGGGRSFWMNSPQYWIYPLQTVVCGIILIRYWPLYELKRIVQPWTALFAGGIALAVWIAPQVLSLSPPRIDGFNPMLFHDHYPIFIGVVFM